MNKTQRNIAAFLLSVCLAGTAPIANAGVRRRRLG